MRMPNIVAPVQSTIFGPILEHNVVLLPVPYSPGEHFHIGIRDKLAKYDVMAVDPVIGARR